MKAIIYWSKDSGLANRLRALVGYQTLSYYLKAPFYLCWVPDPTCDINFAELFDTSKINLITLGQKNSMRHDQEVQICTANSWFSDIWKSHVSDIVPWEDFQKQAVNFLRQLQPVPHITNKVETFLKHNDLQNASAIHVRLTDNVKTYKRWEIKARYFNSGYISKLEGFERFIEDRVRNDPNSKVFLATDNKQIEEYFHHKYQGYIVSYPKKYRKEFRWSFSLPRLKLYHQLQRTSSIEDALIELLLLSKCRIITGTYWSSYSQFSAILGDVEFFVVHGDQYVRDEIVARLKGELPLEET